MHLFVSVVSLIVPEIRKLTQDERSIWNELIISPLEMWLILLCRMSTTSPVCELNDILIYMEANDANQHR